MSHCVGQMRAGRFSGQRSVISAHYACALVQATSILLRAVNRASTLRFHQVCSDYVLPRPDGRVHGTALYSSLLNAPTTHILTATRLNASPALVGAWVLR